MVWAEDLKHQHFMAFEFVGQFCSLWIYFHPERNEKGKENYLYRLKESFSKTSFLLLIGERNASLCYSNSGECARQDILVTANFHANTLAWNKKFPIYPICAKNEPTLHHEWSELWWISLWISHAIVQLCRAEIFIFLCFTHVLLLFPRQITVLLKIFHWTLSLPDS